MRIHVIVAVALALGFSAAALASDTPSTYGRSRSRSPQALDPQAGRALSGPVAPTAGGTSRVATLDTTAAPSRFLAVLDSSADVAALRAAGYEIGGQVGRVVSLYVPESMIGDVVSRVQSLRRPQVMHFNLDVNTVASGAVAVRQEFGVSGAGVLVAVLDSGIDFTHPDFRNPDGTTRIAAIWDQFDQSFATSGGTIGSAPPVNGSGGAPLGTVYTEAQINAALEDAGTVNTVDLFGHGTLVASAAAGNGSATGNGEPAGVYVGTAPEAQIIAVRLGGVTTTDTSITGDSVAALQWVEDIARDLGSPVVVNVSFGGHFGAHDGTTPEEVAISEFAQKPGRAVVVSAGNEGSAAIHASGLLTDTVTLHVFNAAESDILLVDCWLGAETTVDAGFRDPTGTGVDALGVPLGQCLEVTNAVNQVTACLDQSSLTGDHELFFLVERSTLAAPISAGDWSFLVRRLTGPTPARYDCWSVGDQKFTANIDPSVTIAQPGTSDGAITVGAWTARTTWSSLAGQTSLASLPVGSLASFSSLGPTRDLRLKPDVNAGGQFVLGAWSIGDGNGSGIAGNPMNPERVASDGVHVAARGTSFSAPQVAGSVALLLERRPTLLGAEARDLLANTAVRDDFTGNVPNYSWGHGKLNVRDALAALEMAPTPTPSPSPSPTPTATSMPSGGGGGGGCRASAGAESSLIWLAALVLWGLRRSSRSR